MQINHSSLNNTPAFQAKFVLKDEANLLKSCNKRIKTIARIFEEKTAKYPDDTFELVLDKCNDATFVTKITKGKYKDLTPLKEDGLEALLLYKNETIANKFVKLFTTAKKCSKLNADGKNLIKKAKKSSIMNKILDPDFVLDFVNEAAHNIKLDMVKKDKFLKEYVIKCMM